MNGKSEKRILRLKETWLVVMLVMMFSWNAYPAEVVPASVPNITGSTGEAKEFAAQFPTTESTSSWIYVLTGSTADGWTFVAGKEAASNLWVPGDHTSTQIEWKYLVETQDMSVWRNFQGEIFFGEVRPSGEGGGGDTAEYKYEITAGTDGNYFVLPTSSITGVNNNIPLRAENAAREPVGSTWVFDMNPMPNPEFVSLTVQNEDKEAVVRSSTPGVFVVKGTSGGDDTDSAEVIIIKGEMTRPDDKSDSKYFHYAFNTNTPGVAEVPCHVKITPDTQELRDMLLDKVKWTIDGIQGSTLSWQNGGVGPGNAVYAGPLDHWRERAIFTTLPASNDEFGIRNVTVSLDGLNCVQQGLTKIFFARDAFNHPDVEENNVPNWFYYWSQTPAKGGITYYYGGDLPGYAGTLSYCGERKAWTSFIHDGATGFRTLHNVREEGKTYNYASINYFAYVVRHEEMHRQQFITMWGVGGGEETPYDPSHDQYNNYMRDDMADTLVEGRVYTVQAAPTYDDDWNYGDKYRDIEDAAMWEQEWPKQDQYDAHDWAKNGRQWSHGTTEIE